MYKVYFLLTVVFLVCKITFSNAPSFSSLYIDSFAKFKRETLSIQNTTTVQEGDVFDSYTCKNGEVISALFRCDGETDCKDKSDETHELCSGIVCSPYLFSCTYGACISQNKMCDGNQDCIDGSDEDYALCSSNGNQNLSVVVRQKRQNCNFNCGSGDCVSMEQLCDGIADCQDGSDETRAQCGNVRCPSFLFQCNYGACIPKNQVCNGENNCADGSDEEGPGCAKSVTDTCRK
ncbi:lipoprotein receptor [Oryctes borbonicus]|uniref:Lipoprotein receptor n=1 Tax=Oryctes borbonicus TaxID=1629725 RepID=A0A0T6BAS8_9SCAR|nr:lipoprotein receptor [Oryctes borbonicus]